MKRSISPSCFDDDDVKQEKLDFNPTIVYHGYEMHFLKDFFTIQCEMPVELIKSKYTFQVKEFAKKDRKELNKICNRISLGMKLQKENQFIKGTNFLPNKFIPEKKWFLTIVINGFKSKNGVNSPLIKFSSAKLDD